MSKENAVRIRELEKKVEDLENEIFRYKREINDIQNLNRGFFVCEVTTDGDYWTNVDVYRLGYCTESEAEQECEERFGDDEEDDGCGFPYTTYRVFEVSKECNALLVKYGRLYAAEKLLSYAGNTGGVLDEVRKLMDETYDIIKDEYDFRRFIDDPCFHEGEDW